MKIIRCIIADDEVNALDIVESYIEKVDHLTLVARCKDAFEVYNVLQTHTVDLLFLDIEMPQLSGVELFKSLSHPPKIIFTTAYKEYAVQAFELHAVDYLMKPFSFERFLKAIGRIQNIEQDTKPSIADVIFITVDRQKIKICLKDIIYIQAFGNYLKIFTTEKFFITYTSVKSILAKLPSSEFRQIHKSYIISLSKVNTFNSSTVTVNSIDLPIGRAYKSDLKI